MTTNVFLKVNEILNKYKKYKTKKILEFQIEQAGE